MEERGKRGLKNRKVREIEKESENCKKRLNDSPGGGTGGRLTTFAWWSLFTSGPGYRDLCEPILQSNTLFDTNYHSVKCIIDVSLLDSFQV